MAIGRSRRSQSALLGLLAATFGFLVGCPWTTIAEETDILSYLNTQPATLMSVGLVRLNLEIEELLSSYPATTSITKYDDRERVITIGIIAAHSTEGMRDWCVDMVKAVRDKMGGRKAAKSFEMVFSPQGMSDARLPPQTGVALMAATIIIVSGKDFASNKTESCHGDFISDAVSFP